MKRYDPATHADPLLEHAEHAIERGSNTPSTLAAELGIDVFRASKLIVAIDWRGGKADGVAA